MDTGIELSSVKTKETIGNSSDSARLIYISTLPDSSLPCPMCKLYRDISEDCKKFCQRKLLSEITRRSERERVFTEWLYRLTVSPNVTPEGICVTLSVCLTDKTARRTLWKYSVKHKWDCEGKSIIKERPTKE